MTIFIQVCGENDACKFDAVIEGMPDEMFTPPGSDVVTLEGVKTAIDFYLDQQKRAAERAAVEKKK